ncbi:TPA: hypothetical protein ACNH4I_002603 [Serratia marcescens]|uniref:hypothetical protein n=1 Tax=Serratia nevei TaxID=2703794 RepID=UPI003B2E657A
MTSIQRFTPDYKMHAVRFEPFAREAEHGEYVRFDAHQQTVSALEAERDALAVENAALKSAHPQPFGREMMKALDAYEKHQDEVPETGMLDAFFILRDSIRVETPSTDAALAAIQAQGVEKFAAQQEQLAADYRKLSPGCYGETSSAENALMARDFAAELREAK